MPSGSADAGLVDALVAAPEHASAQVMHGVLPSHLEPWKSLWDPSIGLPQRDPQSWVKNVSVPTFLYQVHDDVLTDPGDVQAMFDDIPLVDKKLQWVQGTTRRWDGYLEFQRRP
jgi:hypothetical protein